MLFNDSKIAFEVIRVYHRTVRNVTKVNDGGGREMGEDKPFTMLGSSKLYCLLGSDAV